MSLLTPEFLFRNGFVEVKSGDDLPYQFPFTTDHAGESYVEKEFDRQMFGVNFHNIAESEDSLTGQGRYDCTVCVQVDAGCGFVSIPCDHEWTTEAFENLYFAIRRTYLNKVISG